MSSRSSYYPTMMSLIATDFSIASRNNTHLIVKFEVDVKTGIKRAVIPALIPFIILFVYIIVLFGILFSFTFSISSSFAFPFIFIPIMVGILIAVMVGAVVAQAKKWRIFHVELDKIANKMVIYVPNMYFQKHPRSVYARLGHYFSSAWDLDKLVFRLVMPGEPAGPGAGLIRMMFKKCYLVSYSDLGWFSPNVIFATERGELAQSLMNEIEAFLRGNTGYEGSQNGGLAGNEIPYR